MRMFEDCREGLVSKIVVKKYDRFSRNMREYLNITDKLDKLGVSVVSLCEPFNTDTKEGRMMRNNLLNFAEFEREAIAARVKGSYDTKAQETGFYQGGVEYFGYHEGLVDADVWLAVQDKFSHHQIPIRKGKVLRSWL